MHVQRGTLKIKSVNLPLSSQDAVHLGAYLVVPRFLSLLPIPNAAGAGHMTRTETMTAETPRLVSCFILAKE